MNYCKVENVSNYTPAHRILGFWQLENSDVDKLEFTADNTLNYYVNNTISHSSNYQVTFTCVDNTSADELYLKETDSDGDVYCTAILAGVYADGEETLTLLGDTGKIQVYIRQ